MELSIRPRYAPARLDPATLASVDAWRAGQAEIPCRDEAVRLLILVGIESLGRTEPSEGDKVVASMLGRLISGRDGDSEIEPDLVRAATAGGYLDALLSAYSHPSQGLEIPDLLVKHVVEILDMWCFLEEGFEALSEPERAGVIAEARLPGGPVLFRGFDHQHEEDHAAVAAFLVEQMGLFPQLRERARLNSHTRVLDQYRAMLAVFRPIPRTLDGARLTAAQIGRILRARAA
jgi:uncharacterized protein YfbU (UPF0304 family)